MLLFRGYHKDIENSTESSGGGVELKAVEAVSTQKKEKEIEASEDKKVPELDADDDDDVNTNVTAARLAARMMGEFGPGGYKVPRRGSDDYTGYGGGYGGYED